MHGIPLLRGYLCFHLLTKNGHDKKFHILEPPALSTLKNPGPGAGIFTITEGRKEVLQEAQIKNCPYPLDPSLLET